MLHEPTWWESYFTLLAIFGFALYIIGSTYFIIQLFDKESKASLFLDTLLEKINTLIEKVKERLKK